MGNYMCRKMKKTKQNKKQNKKTKTKKKNKKKNEKKTKKKNVFSAMCTRRSPQSHQSLLCPYDETFVAIQSVSNEDSDQPAHLLGLI